MEETGKRTARIVSLEEAKSIDVILNLENGNCAESVAFLDKTASEYGLQIRYLLVNPSRTVIPDWALKGNMQVVNYLVDFGRKGQFLTSTAEEFAKHKADILLAVSNHGNAIVESIAAISEATLKMGKHSGRKDSPYDMTVRWKLLEHDRNLAADLVNNLKVVTGDKSDEQ